MKPRHVLLAASAAAALVSAAPSAFAATYVATFTTDQVVPPSGYPATATATLEFTPGTRKLKGDVKITGLLGQSSVSLKAGKGACGANDQFLATPLAAASPGATTVNVDVTLLTEQADALVAGNLYLELTTMSVVGAQTRGQLHLQGAAGECAIDKVATIDYSAKLDGAQVTAGTGAAFTGTADVKLNPDSDIVRGRITLNGATPASAKMGVAACGVDNAFTDVDLRVSAHDGVIDFAAKFSDSRQKELAEGKLFLLVTDDPGARVRGQVYPVGSTEKCPSGAGGAGGTSSGGSGGSGGANAGSAGSGGASTGGSGGTGTGGGAAGAGGTGTGGAATGGSAGAAAGSAGASTGGAAGASAGASSGGSAGAATGGASATGGSTASGGSTSGTAGKAGASAGAAGKGGAATGGAAGKAGSGTANTGTPAPADDGGCSIGTTGGSSASLCLLGLAAICAFARRRRS